MTDDRGGPLADVDSEAVTAEDVDADDVRAAAEHEELAVRRRAIAVCEGIAGDDLAHVRPHVDTLATLLTDDKVSVAQRAAGLLVPVADEYPEDFTDHVDEVLHLLDTDLGGLRMLGSNLLASIVVEDTGAAAPQFERIVAALAATDVDVASELPENASVDQGGRRAIRQHESEEAQLRMKARNTLSNVLVAVVEAEPDAVADAAADVVSLLSHDDGVVVASAVDALRAYAEHDPAVVRPFADELVDCLAHDDPVVRARAIRALGFAEVESAVPDLRELADDDPDEDVRDLAAETAGFLS